MGGALYAFRWHREARRFVKRHTRQLRDGRPGFFSSGPLDETATQKDIPPVKGVQALMKRVPAKGHVTFGGRLTPDGAVSRLGHGQEELGRRRDPEQVRAWTDHVAARLRADLPAPPRQTCRSDPIGRPGPCDERTSRVPFVPAENMSERHPTSRGAHHRVHRCHAEISPTSKPTKCQPCGAGCDPKKRGLTQGLVQGRPVG